VKPSPLTAASVALRSLAAVSPTFHHATDWAPLCKPMAHASRALLAIPVTDPLREPVDTVYAFAERLRRGALRGEIEAFADALCRDVAERGGYVREPKGDG
jgi:hypothetical protein